jgi:serine/threonine protein kinase
VLELVPGQSLRARLEAGGPLPWREVVAIGVQLAGALSALNAGGVVHRDVKPDNIMLTPDGNGGQIVKLIDFGVARLADDWDASVSITPTPRRRTHLGVAVGTPGYMPPEAGYEPPCERFDVYGLAATLWELGTGERARLDSPQAAAPCDLPEDLRRRPRRRAGRRPRRSHAVRGGARSGPRGRACGPPEREPSALFDGRYERIAVIGHGSAR